MAKYVVEILGGNGCISYAFGASNNMARLSSAGGVVYLEPDYFRFEDHSNSFVALFDDREFANEVGYACCWNGQRYHVKAARGRVRNEGRVVTRDDLGGEIHGCQER